MDLNIGAALWLAAAGQGKILKVGGSRVDNVNDNGGDVLGLKVGMVYRSAARCVFLGHGADELFGGYGRHRTRFRNAGWQGLSEELEIDVKRLWVRNLGRDDRLVADCSREARHPFLDERVVLQALCFHKISSLTDLRMELGVGDKLVLREILRKLGLPIAAGRVKRAIQFGTRLAKATNAAQFGGTRQANAKQAGRVRLGGKIWLEGKS
jgi:asparagine synthetase B (glutamine-hydrolysing)